MRTVSEHDVGDSTESTEQIGVNGSLEVHTTLVLDTNCDHGDNDGSQDTAESYSNTISDDSNG